MENNPNVPNHQPAMIIVRENSEVVIIYPDLIWDKH
jgi:hypothetical protein